MGRDHISGAPDANSRICTTKVGVLLTIAVVGIIDMPSMFWPGDPMIWRVEAQNILRGRLAIDPAQLPSTIEPGQAVVHNPRNGRWYSKYGLMNSLMLLLPVAMIRLLGTSVDALLIYNTWNVILAVALAAVLMELSGRYTQRLVTRVIFVLATMYGTLLWYYLRAQGSEIYQTLFFALAYLFLVEGLQDVREGDGAGRIWKIDLAWLCIAALVFTRVIYVLLVPLALIAMGVVVVRARPENRGTLVRSIVPHAILPPLLIGLLLGAVNHIKFGSPFLSGYHQWKPESTRFGGNWIEGLTGFLVEPRFNVFLYFPLLAFGLFQLRPFVRRYPMDALFGFSAGITFLLVIAKLPIWSGEWTYGPRYLLPFLPILSLPFILLVDRLIDARRAIAGWVLTGVVSVALFYSAYLQFRVNQVDFFFYYFIREAIDLPRWNEMREARSWEQHVGVFTDQLLRNRDTPRNVRWFEELAGRWPRTGVSGFHEFVRSHIDRGNHYWWAAHSSAERK